MNLKSLFLLFAIIILACGLLPSEVPATEATVPTSVPSEATISPSVVPPNSGSPTDDPIFFRDDFNDQLGDGWTWTREDPGNWSLTAVPGFLQINAGTGDMYDGTVTNLLVRPAPSGDFQFESRLTFSPSSDFQFAGLIIIESSAAFLQAGRAFCGDLTTCVGEGIYIDYFQNGEFILPNYALPYNENAEVYLRLIHQGDAFTLQTSSDGSQWMLRGGKFKMNPLQIGLIAGQSASAKIPALFDYFEVRSVP